MGEAFRVSAAKHAEKHGLMTSEKTAGLCADLWAHGKSGVAFLAFLHVIATATSGVIFHMPIFSHDVTPMGHSASPGCRCVLMCAEARVWRSQRPSQVLFLRSTVCLLLFFPEGKEGDSANHHGVFVWVKGQCKVSVLAFLPCFQMTLV